MKVKIQLPRNVQFIYEHSLAREELNKAFSVSDVSWDTAEPWTFEGNVNGQKQKIIERSAYVADINGQESDYSKLIKPAYQGGLYNRTRSVNQYLTHWIYPYKGKFHPQMIRALINIAGAKPGWLMFEPFCGSGTAALEAQLLGLDVHGIDISPLCVLLAKVKTQAWEFVDEISDMVQAAISNGLSFDKISINKEKSPIIHAFFEIAKMVTLSDESNRGRDPEVTYPKNLLSMLMSITAMAKAKKEFNLPFGKVSCLQDDVRSPSATTKEIKADLIVTSPPYSIALDYVKNDKHALTAMGLDIKKIRENFIGVAGKGTDDKLKRYENDMKAALVTMSKALKPGALAIVIIGDVTISKSEMYTTRDFIKWAKEVDLKFERALPKIVFGLYNIMADEKILFLRKI